jgi:hypothetical protein
VTGTPCACSLVFNDEKKLSIAALCQTLPERLPRTGDAVIAINLWNCSLVSWLPRPE